MLKIPLTDRFRIRFRGRYVVICSVSESSVCDVKNLRNVCCCVLMMLSLILVSMVIGLLVIDLSRHIVSRGIMSRMLVIYQGCSVS